MRTPKEKAESLLAHIQQVADARIRPMMGEYILYVNDKVIGQINHSQLFIKVAPFGEGFAKGLQKESPYDGAKPAFVVPQSKLDDLSWLRDFLTGTVNELEVKQKTIKSAKPKKSEMINGFQIKYHANGITRWSKGKVVNGQPDGYWEWYRPDGTLKRSGYFASGEAIGEWTTYDKEGKVYKVTAK